MGEGIVTCLNSSRVGTRRGRGGGKFSIAGLATAAESTTAAAAMGALASGSVILVSWDVLIVELSKRELASGEMDRRAEGCEAGGESYFARQLESHAKYSQLAS